MVNFGPIFNKNIALQFPQQSGGIQFHLVYTFIGGGGGYFSKATMDGGVVGMKSSNFSKWPSPPSSSSEVKDDQQLTK